MSEQENKLKMVLVNCLKFEIVIIIVIDVFIIFKAIMYAKSMLQ